MSKLGQVVESVENYGKFVLDQVKRARTDEKFGRELLGRWNDIKAKIPITRTPTGLPLPRLALPEIDETGEIARYLFGEGLPGEFPYLNGAYREMYLEPVREIESFERNDAVAAGVSPARYSEDAAGPAASTPPRSTSAPQRPVGLKQLSANATASPPSLQSCALRTKPARIKSRTAF